MVEGPGPDTETTTRDLEEAGPWRRQLRNAEVSVEQPSTPFDKDSGTRFAPLSFLTFDRDRSCAPGSVMQLLFLGVEV